jgi:hypothetical protein
LTWKPSDLLAGWLPVLLVCCYTGMLISIPVAFVTTSILPFAVVGWGGTIGLLFGIAAAGLHSIQVIRTQRLAPAEVDALHAALAEEAKYAYDLVWAETPLAEYQPAAPSAVYSLAWKLYRACADARPIVHHAVEVRVGNVDRAHGILRKDSFLEARLGDESYDIAAWDEKEHRIAWAWTARR